MLSVFVNHYRECNPLAFEEKNGQRVSIADRCLESI